MPQIVYICGTYEDLQITGIVLLDHCHKYDKC